MTASACLSFEARPHRVATAATTKRLAAAGAFSVLLHLAAVELSGGDGSRAGGAVLPQPLSVRLLHVAPPAEEEPQPLVTPQADVSRPAAERPPPPLSQPKPPRAHHEQADARPARATSNTGAAAAAAPDMTYYGAKQLDVYPALATPLLLGRSPQSAPGSSSRALLLVLIDATGVVNEVNLVETNASLFPEDDARRAFLSARFTPAYRNGRAVRSRMLVEVNYGEER